MRRSRRPAERLALGQDLGGTNIVTIAYSSTRGILVRSKVSTSVLAGPRAVVARMAAEALKVRALSGLPASAFAGLGVGSPGPLNVDSGVVLSTPNLPGWRNLPITRLLRQKTRLRCWLENDARCAALGEHRRGAGKGCDDMVVFTLGTGVGGGIILGGKLLQGKDHTAGELGWLYGDPHGARLEFGLPGSLEAMASASGLARLGREAMLRRHRRRGALWRLCGGKVGAVTAKLVHQALRSGDPAAEEAWQAGGQALGSAVAGIINALNPEVVVLAGGVMSGGGKELLAIVRKQAKAGSFPQPFRRCKIVAAQLGDDAGVIGAAEVALERSAR